MTIAEDIGSGNLEFSDGIFSGKEFTSKFFNTIQVIFNTNYSNAGKTGDTLKMSAFEYYYLQQCMKYGAKWKLASMLLETAVIVGTAGTSYGAFAVRALSAFELSCEFAEDDIYASEPNFQENLENFRNVAMILGIVIVPAEGLEVVGKKTFKYEIDITELSKQPKSNLENAQNLVSGLKILETEQKLLSEFIESALSLQLIKIKYLPVAKEYDLMIIGKDKIQIVEGKSMYNLGQMLVKDESFVLEGAQWLSVSQDKAEELGKLIGVRYARNGIEEVGDLKLYLYDNQIFIFNELSYFFNLPHDQKLIAIAESWKSGYPFIFDVRRTMEHLMGHYRYKREDGWVPTSDIADNYKGVDFYQGTKRESLILAKKAVSVKTTLETDVAVWLNYPATKDNLKFLKDGLDQNLGLIDPNNNAVMFIETAEIHILMPKTNVTKLLKDNWLNRLKALEPSIHFEINSIEEFIKN